MSFSYPSTLHHLEALEAAQIERTSTLPEGFAAPADGPWEEFFALDEDNLASIYPDPLPIVIDTDNVDEWVGAIRFNLKAVGIDAPSIRTFTMNGLPAIALGPHPVETPGGTVAENVMTEVFAGSTGYVVVCQMTVAQRSVMTDACTEIIQTFAVPRDASSSAWSALRSSDGAIQISVPPRWRSSDPPRWAVLEATLQTPELPQPLATLMVASDELRGRMSAHSYASMLASGTDMRVIDQGPRHIPAGKAYAMTLTSATNTTVVYAVVRGPTAFGMLFKLGPSNYDLRLLRPTMDAIARTLVLGQP